jgi:hypothetical protein
LPLGHCTIGAFAAQSDNLNSFRVPSQFVGPIGMTSRRLGERLVCVFTVCLAIYCFVQIAAAETSSVPVRIIVVPTREEAVHILEQLEKGADFTAIAREKSTDSTAADGGYMGKVDPASLRQELREALKDLPPGKVSQVVTIPTGFAILKVVEETQPGAALTADPTQYLPLASRGSIRYSANVGGAPEADSALQAFPKSLGWEQDLHAICSARQQSLAGTIERLHGWLDPASSSTPPADPGMLMFVLGQLEGYQGNMDAMLQPWEYMYRVTATDQPDAVVQAEEALGVAYLHKAEMENGLYTKPDDRCTFPPEPGAATYQKTASSETAITYFKKYLAKRPDDLEVRWLLNVAYATLGKYPQGVPAEYLIPPSVFASKDNVGRFTDVATVAGIDMVSMAGGIIVDDFDNDGLLDIVTSSYDMCGHMHFFHNNGDGTFSDRSAQAGLLDQLGGLNIIQADYNNDGCTDILVTRGGWQLPMRMSLLKNNCNGTFTDVTREAGLSEPVSSQSAVWADIDNDGWLDLFVANERGPLHLFRNRGDGTFEDISKAAGVDARGFAKGVVAADYDNDGFPDFYVSNLNGDNLLFHNNHDRTFTELAKKAGVEQPWTSFAAWFFDYDNDGLTDLFVTSYYMSTDEVMRSYLGLPYGAETLKLYKNLGNGAFRDVTKEVGLDRVLMPMGANFGDIDNDGYLDVYMGMGNPSYASMTPHVLLRNQAGKKFVDVTTASGTGDLHKGHAVAFADVDRDGDEDILTVVGGAVPGDAHAFRLYENPGNGNHWINLRLVGVKSNRSAIGARIKVVIEEDGKTQRSIYRTVGSGGSFGASPLEQHIGLGKAARIVNLEVWWPTSDTHQAFAGVGVDQFLEIKEFAKDYVKLQRHSFRLGGSNRGTAVAKAQ